MKWAWLLLAAAVGLVAVLASIDGPAAESGSFAVAVIGPDGALLSTTVNATQATAYTVLRIALAEAGLSHEATGRGEALFVTSIAGIANDGQGGWCYAVWDGGWIQPPIGADAYGLRSGQATQWTYQPGGCDEV